MVANDKSCGNSYTISLTWALEGDGWSMPRHCRSTNGNGPVPITLNRKVAGSIPDGVIGFFFFFYSFRSHYAPGVDSASNRN
jgi:hypothetical protein